MKRTDQILDELVAAARKDVASRPDDAARAAAIESAAPSAGATSPPAPNAAMPATGIGRTVKPLLFGGGVAAVATVVWLAVAPQPPAGPGQDQPSTTVPVIVPQAKTGETAQPAIAGPTATPPARTPQFRHRDARPPVSAEATAVEEVDLIRQARGELAASPASALAILGRHAKLFPSGELAQERETLAIEALVRLGRRADASARAAAFTKRYPESPLRARIKLVLDGAPVDRLSP